MPRPGVNRGNQQPSTWEIMKTRLTSLVRFLSAIGLAAWAVGPRASAQTPPVLNLQLYAGVTVIGLASCTKARGFFHSCLGSNGDSRQQKSPVEFVSADWIHVKPEIGACREKRWTPLLIPRGAILNLVFDEVCSGYFFVVFSRLKSFGKRERPGQRPDRPLLPFVGDSFLPPTAV